MNLSDLATIDMDVVHCSVTKFHEMFVMHMSTEWQLFGQDSDRQTVKLFILNCLLSEHKYCRW